MLLVELAPDDDRMHDREDARLLEIGALLLRVIREEPAHPVGPSAQGRGAARRIDGIDLALGDHLRQRLLGTDGAELEFGRQAERDLFLAPGLLLAAAPIFDAGRVNAV